MEEEPLYKKIFRVLTNRLLILSVIACVAFYALAMQLFNLQIINGSTNTSVSVPASVRWLTVPAPRGTIYDRYGRPLAINETSYTLKIDPTTQSQAADTNTMLYNLVKLLEEDGQSYVDNFPISKDQPYRFVFNSSTTTDKNWKKYMGISDNMTAEQAFKFLRDQFQVDPAMSDTEARKLLIFRSMLHLQLYYQWQPITVAYDLTQQTIADVTEHTRDFPGTYVDTQTTRAYPYGEYMSHIVGYIGSISADEYDALKDQGYSQTDLIGKTGLESAFEGELRGTNGSTCVEVNNASRRIDTLSSIDPIQGDKIFTTIDAELEKTTFGILEKTLTDVLIAKMKMKATATEQPITTTQFFASMLNSNNIDMKKIMTAPDGTVSANVRAYVLKVASAFAADDLDALDVRKNIASVVADGLNKGQITPADMLIVLLEQGIITADIGEAALIQTKQVNVLDTLVEKMQAGQITPQMTDLEPCTGSVVVEDVRTGDVLASVSYPTYDANKLVNNIDYDYYTKLISGEDPTKPLINRAFNEKRAPGSTFKMITAIAGLESGAITPTTQIYDNLQFTLAGAPYPKCYSSYTHGWENVVKALEVSCNYFFCDVAWLMGNPTGGNADNSIKTMEKYMDAFGLNGPTGVEIGESVAVMSSPEYKKSYYLSQNPDASIYDYQWVYGDTLRTAFGQGSNNYTSASMVKYIATLATGGLRYQMHFLDEEQTADGQLIQKFTPNLETTVNVSQSTWQTVYDGMLAVTGGTQGTATKVFQGFPVTVAGKTGTAQENGADHISFGGFAPYDNPQIAVYVMLPHSSTSSYSAPAAVVARDVIAAALKLDGKPQYSTDNTLVP